MLFGELLPGGSTPPTPRADLIDRYRESGDRPVVFPETFLAAAGLLVRAFPFDPALPELVDACDETLMKARFGHMWKPQGVQVRRVRVKPLGYTPGARAALLYETLSICRRTGLPEVRRVVGKLDSQREAAEIFARSWAVWQGARQRFRLAPPVGFMARPNLFFQEYVDGVRLSDLAGTGDFAGPVRQAARAIATLHDLPLPLRFRRASLQSVKVARRWAKIVAAIRPENRKRVASLRDRLVSELEIRATVTGPIHGDLHPSNMLVDDGQLTLIDLDNLVLGDRLLDVGRFLSALRTSSLRVHGTPDGLSDIGESFLEHYLHLTGEDERRARLFEAAALLTSAGTGFRLQREGWEQATQWLLDECERALDRSGAPRAPRPRPSEAEMKRRDSDADDRRSVDRVAWATDPQYVRGLLGPGILRVYGAEVAECLAEHKGERARRDHLRFHLTGWRGDARFKITLDGFLRHGKSGRSQSERVATASTLLADRIDAPLLPRPIAFVRELGLEVVESPRGTHLLDAIDARTGDGLEALERTGQALAVLHATPIPCGRPRSLDDELGALREEIAEASAAHPVLGRTMAGLLERVLRIVESDLDATAATVRHLSPRRVELNHGRVLLTDVDDVVGCHPLLDVATFLGRVRAALPDADDGTDPLDPLRRAYLEQSGASPERLAAFEALTLLRAACVALRRDGDEASAHRLSNLAEARAGLGALREDR
jgi:aminoglycoside phosphotransferase (APT) family kinase protein